MLPALIVGALTAWYLGIRTGVIVAVVTAAAMLIAAFVPGMTITVLKPSALPTSARPSMSSVFGSPLGQATTWAKKQWDGLFGSSKK